MLPSPELRAAVEQIVDAPIERWARVEAGHTRPPKWRVHLRGGSTALVKTSDGDALDTELLVYRSVEGAFLPRLIGLEDAEALRVLVLEDLTDAQWPPPYPDDGGRLFGVLDQVASTPPPHGLPALSADVDPFWEQVRGDPEPLLRLGLCSPKWLEAALDVLIDAERRVILTGNDFVHNDVYSANLCFASRGPVLVDWAQARRGNGRLDVAFALLSIRVEGGVLPQQLDFPDEPVFAAWLSGYLAVEAPAPLPKWTIPGSTLREDMAGDLAHALAWVAEALGLPPPLG